MSSEDSPAKKNQFYVPDDIRDWLKMITKKDNVNASSHTSNQPDSSGSEDRSCIDISSDSDEELKKIREGLKKKSEALKKMPEEPKKMPEEPKEIPEELILDSSTSDDSPTSDNSPTSDDVSSPPQKRSKTDDDDDKSEESDHSDYSFEFTDENCDKRIAEFVEITKSNSALAMFFLQDRKWNVERSVNDYFAEMMKKEKKGRKRMVLVRPDSSASEADDEGEDAAARKRKSSKAKNSSSTSKSGAAGSSSTSASTSVPGPSSSGTVSSVDVVKKEESTSGKLFRHVTWNIDGMQPKNLELRMKAICDLLVKEKVSIVFLQEVTTECEEILEKKLGSKFQFFTGFNCTTEYYTLTLVSKGSFFKAVNCEVLEYDNTFMGRNLLMVQVSDGKRKYCLLNTHLESTKDGTEFRVEQLKFLFNYFKTLPRDMTVIAGGDLNLRDKEVTDIGGIPRDVIDAWIASGCRKECEFTWDTLRNDTCEVQGKWKPRCRFDRVYVRRAAPLAIQLVHFGLIGIERLRPNVCFPSDHWGVITSYKFE